MGYTPRSASIFKAEFEECRKLCIAQRGFIKSIHTWWGISELKLLKEVGLRFSACHASSANTERIFSALNKASTPSRNRSGVTNLFNLMMIRIFNLSCRTSTRKARKPSLDSENELPEEEQRYIELNPELVEECEAAEIKTAKNENIELSVPYLKFKNLINYHNSSVENVEEDTEISSYD